MVYYIKLLENQSMKNRINGVSLMVLLIVFNFTSFGIRAQSSSGITPEDLEFGTFRVLLSNDRVTNYQVGQRFVADQKIRVRSSRYVALIHRNGGIIEINKGGIYRVQDLQEQLLQYQKQQQKKQVTLAIHNEQRHYYLEAMYPAGLPVYRCKFHQLRFLMPHKSSTFNPKIRVAWKPNAKNRPEQYKLTVMNLFEDTLATYYTKQTSQMIDLSAYAQYKDTKFFLLKIEQGPKDAEKIALSCPPENITQQDLAQFYQANKQQNQGKGMQQLLLEVFFLKKHGLLLLARDAFQRLLKKYPQRKMLRRGFVQFEFEAGFRESFVHLRSLKIGEKSIFDQ